MVPAVSAPQPPPAPPPAPAENDAASESCAQPYSPAPSRPDPVLYLDCEVNGQCHAVRSGWTLGQAHAGSTAEAQLSGIPGVQYVHRRHCRFEQEDGIWYLCPLPQAEYTNPTTINGRTVAPGERAAVRNGDRITLAGIRLTARLLPP